MSVGDGVIDPCFCSNHHIWGSAVYEVVYLGLFTLDRLEVDVQDSSGLVGDRDFVARVGVEECAGGHYGNAKEKELG